MKERSFSNCFASKKRCPKTLTHSSLEAFDDVREWNGNRRCSMLLTDRDSENEEPLIQTSAGRQIFDNFSTGHTKHLLLTDESKTDTNTRTNLNFYSYELESTVLNVRLLAKGKSVQMRVLNACMMAANRRILDPWIWVRSWKRKKSTKTTYSPIGRTYALSQDLNAETQRNSARCVPS